MIFSKTPGEIKRFRRSSWKFQETFLTPLKELERFTSIIITAHAPLEGASVTIDEVVFEPKTLNSLMTKHSISEALTHDVSLDVTGGEEVKVLLCSALSDWVDFLFVPTPKPFVIYADHDEYTTFYANTKGNLNRIVEALATEGFKKVEYERNL